MIYQAEGNKETAEDLKTPVGRWPGEYMIPQIARKTDPHTVSYTGACGVPWGVSWGVCWVSPGGSLGGPLGDPPGGPPIGGGV